MNPGPAAFASPMAAGSIPRQMQTIHERWGMLIAQVSGSTAVSGTAVKPALLAAIIANESDGDPNAKRFEPEVLLELWAVLMGRKPAFGSIRLQDLAPLVVAPAGALRNLDALATSWGLTQIMGYNFLAGVKTLTDPSMNLHRAIGMLMAFANEFKLSLADHSGDLLSCWNTGEPIKGRDPSVYVQNGLERMAAYQAILDAPAGSKAGV